VQITGDTLCISTVYREHALGIGAMCLHYPQLAECFKINAACQAVSYPAGNACVELYFSQYTHTVLCTALVMYGGGPLLSAAALVAPLQVGNFGRWRREGEPNTTAQEDRSHFALWALLKAPLLIGADLRVIPPSSLQVCLIHSATLLMCCSCVVLLCCALVLCSCVLLLCSAPMFCCSDVLILRTDLVLY
jgi:hypothetical protein